MTGKISPVFSGKVSKNNKVELPKEEQNNINDKNIDKNDNDKTNKNKPVKNPTLPGVLAGKILPSAYPKLFPFINISSGMIPPMKNPKETTKFPLAGLIRLPDKKTTKKFPPRTKPLAGFITPPDRKPKNHTIEPTAGLIPAKSAEKVKKELENQGEQLVEILKKHLKNKTKETDNK